MRSHEHAHAHQHSHESHGHDTGFAVGTLLNAAFVVVEGTYGLVGHSMALLADAGHNLTQQELDTYWERLSEGGEEIKRGWLKDKYGLSWQIAPTILPELMQDKDPEKRKRVMQAMLKMVKLDIEGLKRAYQG
ncbi:MAG TPA: VOC family protein [Stellaceae bacterium]|nr:VOC family protein [Stellaceae bacterium]